MKRAMQRMADRAAGTAARAAPGRGATGIAANGGSARRCAASARAACRSARR